MVLVIVIILQIKETLKSDKTTITSAKTTQNQDLILIHFMTLVVLKNMNM